MNTITSRGFLLSSLMALMLAGALASSEQTDAVLPNQEKLDAHEIPTESRAIGDFNADGSVNFSDFLFLLENWGVEFDGVALGFSDFLVMLENWGSVPEYTIMLPGDVSLSMVRIPAGSFVMGSPEDERSRMEREGPQTNVTISKYFYMGKYTVTQGQYEAVMGAGNWPDPTSNPDRTGGLYGRGDFHPMYYVSWHDAQDFIDALNQHIAATGQRAPKMRLPTEAEWEYACRAGTTTRFFFGDSLEAGDDCEGTLLRAMTMWYCGNRPTAQQYTKPVGGLLANPWLLHDMHGNVREWCQDWYHHELPGGSVTDPTGPATGTFKVLRGGHYASPASSCRSATRSGTGPSHRANSAGFRLVCDP